MRKLFTLIMLLTITLGANAQEKEWNMAKHDKSLICGEGVGATKEEADRNALTNLISQISVYVTENTDITISNQNGEGGETSQFNSSVSTYSSQALPRTKRYEYFKAPNWIVGRSIPESTINEMFEQRTNKAKDLVASAEKAIKKGHIDDALRNYYWALTLLKSVQYPNAVIYKEANGTEHVMTVWIKDQIDDIIDDVKITCQTREGDDIDVDITYKDKPVNSLGLTYYDGRQWTSIVTANDGFAKLEFVNGFSAKEIKVRLEYQFKNEAKTDKELESVLNAVNGSEFRRAEKTIRSIKEIKKEQAQAQPAAPALPRPSFTSTHARQIKPPTEVKENIALYADAVSAVEKAIRAKSTADIRKYFTNEGWDIYTRLIDYGSAKIVGMPTYKFLADGEYVTARGLKMSFSFKYGTKKSFVEDVIFTFDNNNQICNISFGLGRTAEDDILNRGAWGENVRVAIMNFLENYKTAYALKRFDYIQSIFDEDAIIITGRTVKRATRGGDLDRNTMNSQQVIYNKQTKQQYMESLKKCFASQEFVNIHFANNEVRKSNREGAGELYGIQLEQDYHSSTYGDHGYLFLLVDMNDAKQPVIKIRTWQPEKNPDGSIYGIGDF